MRIILALATLAATPAFAHPGHGDFSHEIGIVALMILVGIGAAALARHGR